MLKDTAVNRNYCSCPDLCVLRWQALMAAAPEVPGAVEACCIPGRQERLDLLLEQLEMCEKALQVCRLIGLVLLSV